MENLHKGHRARVKQKFKNGELKNFAEHEVLELLLFFAVPQKDTNELAHKLIKKFGSLSNVLDAPYELLIKENGVGENVAVLLKLIMATARYCKLQSHNKKFFKDTRKIAEFMISRFEGQQKEQLYVLCLDDRLNVTAMDSLFEGEVNSVGVSWRKIIQYIVLNDASSVILCHNHPAGLPMPSSNDMYFTKNLKNMLKSINVNVVDHIIVSGSEYASMKEMGLLLDDRNSNG
ncbi:MAG: DNA repair protein RadC [Oscillospiraceae bacterium]|jgi:DNA repair protein RadC|nr:DNA repair protein RadC [Oscillospiraceae bacterium]